jgi:hypothetical protein
MCLRIRIEDINWVQRLILKSRREDKGGPTICADGDFVTLGGEGKR